MGKDRIVTKAFLASARKHKAAPVWICHLCGQEINKRYKTPHPLSVEIDHIVPYIYSQDDSFENTALSHRKCNRAKSDSLYTNKILKQSSTLKRRT